MNTLLSKKSIFIIDDFNPSKIRLIGFEPITFGTEIQRSIHLSYKRITKKNDSTTNNFKSS